jgi:hypothetical protein
MASPKTSTPETPAPYADDEAVRRVGRGFAERTLQHAEWTHAAHFAAALWLMRERPDFMAERDMPGMIRAYNAAVGTPNSDAEGYHETITLASLRAARAWLARHDDRTPLWALVAGLMASPLGRSDWLLAHWSRERLFSVAARRAWVEPDLAPLAF